jgi:Predicted membrane protein (DUF2142)
VRRPSFVPRVGAVIHGLRSSHRRVWWTSFVLVTALCGLWALASPVFAGPDEPAHVVRADALDHGQLTGREPRDRLDSQFRTVRGSARVVEAPEIYQPVSGPPCFVHERDILRCFRLVGSSRDTDVVTYAANQPPAYYAVVGIVSLLRPPGAGTVYLMRMLTGIITGAFVATAITALRRLATPALVAAGLALALTPTALFISGAVNPNAPEIAASISFWVCGVVLVSTSSTRIDKRLVTAVGIAGCVLALSRQLGPLWLGLIALAILGLSNRSLLANVARSSWARMWAILVAASAAAQIAWDLIVRPRDATLVGETPTNLSTLDAIEDAFGSTFRWYREMIGRFGWLDTPAPQLTWLLWTAVLAFFVFVALAWADRRHVAILFTVLAGVIVVPIVIAATPYRAAGTLWQGRYALPLAFGVPLLAAFALAATERGRQLVTTRFALCVGFTLGVAHLLAFAQNMRRYTVGTLSEIQYWEDTLWSPPVLSPLPLTLAYAAVLIAFTAWLLWPESVSRRSLVTSSASQTTPDT